MATDAVQKGRLLSIDTPAGKDVLLINRFEAEEAISEQFLINVELLAETGNASNVDPDKLIGKPMTLQIAFDVEKKKYRYFHGMCRRFSVVGKDKRFLHYQAELVPWSWLLSQTSDCRIFNNKKVPDIVKEIFDELKKDFDFVEYQDKTQSGNYTEVDYLVQYRETDLQFVSRLMEQEGIHYYFKHEKDKHTLVLADAPHAHEDCSHQSKLRYEPEGGWDERDKEIIQSWQMEKQMRPGEFVLRDYQFQMPSKTLEVKKPTSKAVGSNTKLEMFDYLGQYAQRFNDPDKRMGEVEKEGNKLVGLRMEEAESPHVQATGNSTCCTLMPGFTFSLEKHFDEKQNQKYVLSKLHHSGVQPADYVTGEETTEAPYENSFTCIPHDVSYRPARSTPKPIVDGVQSAVVVGKKGEEIWTDKYGRVQVKFHWDRDDKKKHGDNSCWVRVSQAWAGKRWGAFFIPRIGQEVLVAFMEGDPDQPVIVGSVYNAEQMPAYTGDGPDKDHGQDPKVSGIKTNTTKDGKGFNELRFDDTKDKEQFFIHAQKNMDVRVLNDSLEKINGDRHQIIGDKNDEKSGDQLELIYRDKQQNVKRHQIEHIEGNMELMIGNGDASSGGKLDVVIEDQETKSIGKGGQHLTVDGDCEQKIGGDFALQTNTGNVYIKAAKNLVIEGTMQVTLKVGSSFVNISPKGVDIMGPLVNINSGGAGGVGKPPKPDKPKKAKPKMPDEADKAKTGSKSSAD
jgi:type VI secretion system secreted protein VgrG